MQCLFSQFLTCVPRGTHPSFIDVNEIWSSARLPVCWYGIMAGTQTLALERGLDEIDANGDFISWEKAKKELGL